MEATNSEESTAPLRDLTTEIVAFSSRKGRTTILGIGDCDGDKISDNTRDGDGRTSEETDTSVK